MTGNVYCVGCGEVVHPEARFFRSCGGELAPAMTVRPQPPTPPPAPSQPTPPMIIPLGAAAKVWELLGGSK